MGGADSNFAHYWNMLYGSEEADSFVELRHRLVGRDGMGRLFYSVEERDRCLRRLQELARQTDVYLGVAPRTERAGGRAAIRQTHVLWADCDTEEAVRRLRKINPPPSMVIQSGSGCHGYWALAEPLGVRWIERANRRLAYALRADMPVSDPARILRPPGTFNYKKKTRVLVRVAKMNHVVYPARAVVGGLPDAPGLVQKATKPTFKRGLGQTAHDFLLSLEPREYVEHFTGEEINRAGKACCPVHEETDPSLQVYSGDKGFYCFGCQLGGTVYDLAAAVWKLDVRRDFPEIQGRLMREFS